LDERLALGEQDQDRSGSLDLPIPERKLPFESKDEHIAIPMLSHVLEETR
jgi:hypothetical protein